MNDVNNNKEFDDLMEEVSRRTASLQDALEPVLSQLILADIRKQQLPYGMPNNEERLKEMEVLEIYLKKMIDNILGF